MEASLHMNVPTSSGKPSQKSEGCYCSKGLINSILIPWFCNKMLKKTDPDHYSASTKLYSWQVASSWHPPNPDLSILLPDFEAWFITPENAFPLFQSPMASSFTPLQTMLDIAHGGLRLVCGSFTMETHFMKLQTNSSCADVSSRGCLELSSELSSSQRSWRHHGADGC